LYPLGIRRETHERCSRVTRLFAWYAYYLFARIRQHFYTNIELLLILFLKEVYIFMFDLLPVPTKNYRNDLKKTKGLCTRSLFTRCRRTLIVRICFTEQITFVCIDTNARRRHVRKRRECVQRSKGCV
jgi:hypothetical protein